MKIFLTLTYLIHHFLNQCSIIVDNTVDQFTPEEQYHICYPELVSFLLGKYYSLKTPSKDTNTIFLQLNVAHIQDMNHSTKISKLQGQLAMRWKDAGLRWDPLDWAGVDMVYMASDQVWKPDFMITNQSTNSTFNIGKADSTLVRVWADAAPDSDIQAQNVEWTPYLQFEVHHDFDFFQYPVDLQDINIRIDSWMTIPGYGGIKIDMLSNANSAFTTDIDYVKNYDNQMINDASATVHSYDFQGKEFQQINYKINVKRVNNKFFTVVQLPAVFILILEFMNIAFANKDSKIRNGITMLVVCVVILNINYGIVPHNKVQGLFEIVIIIDQCVVFVSNINAWIEFQIEMEIDSVTIRAKDFSLKQDLFTDHSIPNKINVNQKNYLKWFKSTHIFILSFVIQINIVALIQVETLFQEFFIKFISQILALILQILAVYQFSTQFQQIKSINILKKVDSIQKIQDIQLRHDNEINDKIIKYYEKSNNKEIANSEAVILLNNIQSFQINKYAINFDNLKETLNQLFEIQDTDQNGMMDQIEMLTFMRGMSSSVDLDRKETMIEKAEVKQQEKLKENIEDFNKLNTAEGNFNKNQDIEQINQENKENCNHIKIKEQEKYNNHNEINKNQEGNLENNYKSKNKINYVTEAKKVHNNAKNYDSSQSETQQSQQSETNSQLNKNKQNSKIAVELNSEIKQNNDIKILIDNNDIKISIDENSSKILAEKLNQNQNLKELESNSIQSDRLNKSIQNQNQNDNKTNNMFQSPNSKDQLGDQSNLQEERFPKNQDIKSNNSESNEKLKNLYQNSISNSIRNQYKYELQEQINDCKLQFNKFNWINDKLISYLNSHNQKEKNLFFKNLSEFTNNQVYKKYQNDLLNYEKSAQILKTQIQTLDNLNNTNQIDNILQNILDEYHSNSNQTIILNNINSNQKTKNVLLIILNENLSEIIIRHEQYLDQFDEEKKITLNKIIYQIIKDQVADNLSMESYLKINYCIIQKVINHINKSMD